MKERILEIFNSVFSEGGARVFFAPGRVNLIGEHTDYNGGHVFPCALTIGTYAAVKPRSDTRLRFYSENFADDGIVEAEIGELIGKDGKTEYSLCSKGRLRDSWIRYCLAVIGAFAEKGLVIGYGMDFACIGNIPNGSGLSSSASLEVLTGTVLNALYGFKCTGEQLALLGQRAENAFVGVNCGIMDQFAIAMGKKDNAIFLDTATLKYEYVPIKPDGIKVVIGNTKKKRGLGDSKYNERRAECEKALKEMQLGYAAKKGRPGDENCAAGDGFRSLGDLDNKEFEVYSEFISDADGVKRARHAVSENRRTIEAVQVLKNGDIAAFGRLMDASHDSLSRDYEVTGIELDTMVASAHRQEGVLGARMTGAGFGGCTVALVREDCVNKYIEAVTDEYTAVTGLKPEFYVVDIGDGPLEL